MSRLAFGSWDSIRACPLPPEALLARYSGTGGYADCYTTPLERAVSHAEFVEAFYTGGVFKVERLLLKLFLSKPSKGLPVRRFARGVTRGCCWARRAHASPG